MSLEVKAALIGVGGALLVWLVSWLWTLRVEGSTRKRARVMLSMEMEENLQKLSKWRQRTGESVTFSQSPLAGVQLADALRNLELPAWSHRVWEGAVQLVPIALDEEEIKQVHRFHQELDGLSQLKRRDDLKPSEMTRLVSPAVEELLKSGNPLKKP